MTPLVVLACGNPSRGDDAIGPQLLARIAKAFPDLPTVEDFQFQVEHVLDMEDAALVLFLDAGTGDLPPISFTEVFPHKDTGSASTHAMEPSGLLAVFETVVGRAPPPAFVFCVRGETFGLGEPMSEAAAARLDEAWPLLGELCETPDAEIWRARVTVPSSAPRA